MYCDKRLKECIVPYRAMGRHLQHGITPATQHKNTPCLNASQKGWYSIYLSQRDGRLS